MSDDTTAAKRYTPAALEALTAFGIRSAALELVAVSENITFKATDERGRAYVLRLHRPGYHTLDELNSERVWIRALADACIVVPTPVTATDGREYVRAVIDGSAEARYVGLAQWTDGELLADVLRHTADVGAFESYFEQLGVLAARLHDQASRWQLPPGFERHALDADGLLGDAPFWGRFWENPVLSLDERDLVLRTRDRLHEMLGRVGYDAATFSLIHADLHPGNLLVHGDRLAIIDFDDAGFGWHAYDMAVAMIRYREEPTFAAVKRAFVRGYRTTRSLPDDVVALIPTFFVIRDMAILGWIHQRPELGRTDATRIKNRLCAECQKLSAA